MSRRLLVLLAAAVVVGVVAGLDAGGAARALTCPTPSTKANFDLEQYLGKWFEMKSVPREFEKGGSCGTAEYSYLTADKNSVNVINRNFLPSLSEYYSVNLVAEPVDAPNGKFQVKFPAQPQVPLANYWVLDTDYSTYSVVYSCSEAAPAVSIWVMTRRPDQFTADLEKKLDDLIKEKGLFTDGLVTMKQTCPSTTCSAELPSKENLQVDKLKGRWWEVQHSTFATKAGDLTCGLGDISSTSTGIRIAAAAYENSKKKDASVTIEGKWSDSQSKKGSFDVTLGENRTAILKVIDTDYDNYAVVSLCGELGADKAVLGGVYVLSRGRGLTPEQQTNANKAVVSAGLLAASLEGTASTPCPKAASTEAPSSGGALTTSSITCLVLALLAALLSRK